MSDFERSFYKGVFSSGTRKSELFLSTATVEDNGTFACVAENKAGRAVARFTLHVVVPVPPKPPQVCT